VIVADDAERREHQDSTGEDWEHAGNKTGNPGNIFISHDLPIPPFEPVPLTLPISHPALRSETSRGTNLVGLCPLCLRFVDTFLQDFRDCRALLALQPRSDYLFPRIAFIARLLLITGQLYQIWRVKPVWSKYSNLLKQRVMTLRLPTALEDVTHQFWTL